MKILPSPTLPVRAAATIGFDHLVDQRLLDRDFDARLRHEIDDIFGATVQLGVAAADARTPSLQ